MRKTYKKISDKSDLQRYRRRLVIRKTISGTTDRPRICPVKSNKHLSVQLIDDTKSVTIVAVNTFGKNGLAGARNNKEGAKAVGKKLAEVMKSKNITSAVFDRAGYKYTGVIAALVDSVRENGIQV